MPIICLFNSPKVGLFNSRTFTIVEINNEGVKLSDNVFVPKKLFTFKPSKTGKAKFDYAFCMTVHKFQGSEIKEDFCIYEIQKMDKRLLNTALTRGQTLDKVHFNYTTKKFIVRKFNEKSIASKIHVPQHKTGRIYLITNDQGQGYIGSTEKQIEERFEEHKTEAVNRNMEDFMKSKVKIVLVQEIKFTNKKTLLILEDQKINEYAEKYELMNVKINIRDKPKGIKHKQVVVEQKSYIAGKFKIECLEKTHTYRIRWCIDGEKNTKSFKWNKDVTKEEAYTKIKQVQLDLIKLFS
jgi:predicted GIY-YIG superfamily endonuclease